MTEQGKRVGEEVKAKVRQKDSNGKDSIDKNSVGKVWLCGAGPGDVSLLTLKTAQLLEEADVIVYDALLSAEILCRIPPGKENIHVGKRSGNHAVPQEEINRILVREAKKGKKVLRLKGGDPFVFGRGGEELELLKEEGIPFEVVPGVTSCTAVPAYAGIPVTHRDYTSSFHVITGHARKDGSLHIDFEALARLNGTLIFLMGMARLSWIAEGLLKAGMAKETPAAVLENGTNAGQKKVVASLADISRRAKEEGIGTPAIIVVGKVCALSETFSWAEKRSLGGRLFLTTRPIQNSSAFASRLRRLGAQVIEMPSIETEEIRPNPVLDETLQKIGREKSEEWLVFTSPIGVSVFFEGLKERKIDVRALYRRPAQIKVAAIGSATANALKEHGLFADLVPQTYSAKELGNELASQAGGGSHVTILRAKEGSPLLLPPLLEAGLTVSDIALYETHTVTDQPWKEKIADLLASGAIDGVTFTSASTVRGFVRAMEGLDFTTIEALCIGEQTKAEAQKYHMRISVAPQASMDGMETMILEKYGI